MSDPSVSKTINAAIQLNDSQYVPGDRAAVGSDFNDTAGNQSSYAEMYHSSFSDFFAAIKGEDVIRSYNDSGDAPGDYAEITPIQPGAGGDPTIKDLNPYERHNFNSDGTVLVKSTAYGLSSNQGGKCSKGNFDTMSVRGFALRVPVMMSGWGFDTDGNATFDAWDDKLPGGSGIKTGPLDIRWNEERHVWVASGGDSLPDHLHLKSGGGGLSFSTAYPATSGEVVDSGLINIIDAELIES